MDLSGLSNALPSFTSSIESNKNSMIVPESKRTRFLATYLKQDFSLPKTIMFYVAKHPTTPECYQQMTKICKFFFYQNQIIILSESIYDGIKWQKPFNLPSKVWYPKLRINYAKVQSKFWITKTLEIDPKNENASNIVSSILPKFFRFDAKKLIVRNQVIPYKEFAYLTSSAETIFFFDATVKDENGSVISLEKFVETAAKAKELHCWARITRKTFAELLKLPNFHKLDWFCFYHIPEAFDIEAFYKYMKKNRRTYFQLIFDDPLSEAYKNRLEEIIDEIIATKNHEYRPPFFIFPGFEQEEKSYLLFDLSKSVNAF